MDPLVENDIQLAQSTPPGEKLRQALDLMRTGLGWKRAALCVRHPQATSEQIDRMLVAWLAQDE